MTRRICYITGTRADFGLMRSTLEALAAHPSLALELVVTGMHLDPAHGDTIREVRASGLRVAAEVPVALHPATGATMARNLGRMVQAFADHLEHDPPRLVLLLGDRGEMLAGAIAAIHLNITVAHIHGGERSGTVDEPVRHAISKLSHLHFVATEGARERLVRMGERADHVWVSGAPGLDGLEDAPRADRTVLCAGLGLRADRPVALMVCHPVLQEAEQAGDAARIVMDALLARGLQVVALMPNSDAGSDAIRDALRAFFGREGVRLLAHLPRAEFIGWMACCDVMVGNSSAGIIEAASFGTPVVNVGSRQNLRERNANTLDAAAEPAAVAAALDASLRGGRQPARNVYGDGRAAVRIVEVLASQPLDPALMAKVNAY
jgi:GDP/UDP-N,N'-diacetylbacillosamine 2-epimerase (hydrolysing)